MILAREIPSYCEFVGRLFAQTAGKPRSYRAGIGSAPAIGVLVSMEHCIARTRRLAPHWQRNERESTRENAIARERRSLRTEKSDEIGGPLADEGVPREPVMQHPFEYRNPPRRRLLSRFFSRALSFLGNALEEPRRLPHPRTRSAVDSRRAVITSHRETRGRRRGKWHKFTRPLFLFYNFFIFYFLFLVLGFCN